MEADHGIGSINDGIELVSPIWAKISSKDFYGFGRYPPVDLEGAGVRLSALPAWTTSSLLGEQDRTSMEGP